MKYEDITLVLGVDSKHLKELRLVWPGWLRFKSEVLRMPCVVFYDATQVQREEMAFLNAHPSVRFVPWDMPGAKSQREKMLAGFVHVPANEVKTTWYLKIDTDVIATAEGEWIRDEWFCPDNNNELPVFISSPWGYTKPANVMDLLDDWADGVPMLAKKSRLNLPHSERESVIKHSRIIGWLFFGRTDWTREMVALLDSDGRLPYPSQDSFMYYCAKRLGRHYHRVRMREHGWDHRRIVRHALQGSSSSGDTDRSLESKGVIYFNVGTGCAVRLLVSITSLREHYSGPITILSEGEESHILCERIAKSAGAHVLKWNSKVSSGKNAALLAKTRLHLGTPYHTTVAIDSDTLVLGPVDELFAMAKESAFCVAQLGERRTTGKIVRGRLQKLASILPQDLEAAIRFGPSINTGVTAFTKAATIFADWYDVAAKARDQFIPDEVSCQMILHRHPHRILDGRWNRSCKHDNPDLPDTRIIHYHGRKHCREGLPYHGDKWMNAFCQVYAKNVADVRDWMPAGDRMLKKYLKAHPLGYEDIKNNNTTSALPRPPKLCIILGAGRTQYEGWRSTERNELNIIQEEDFKRILRDKLADRFLAEHVWEHLCNDSLKTANALAFKYLKPGGCLRIAVPDGLHPDPAYLEWVKPNGTGKSARDHQQLFTHTTLTACLESAGFVVNKLEHWDEEGHFHVKSWSSDEGHVKRSALHDRRNRLQPLSYTSLIVDAHKPLTS